MDARTRKLEKWTALAMAELGSGEKPVVAVLGGYEAKLMGNDTVRNAVIIATESSVVIFAKRMFGHEMEQIPYTRISSVESGKNFMGGMVKIHTSGADISVKWIADGEHSALADAIRQRIG